MKRITKYWYWNDTKDDQKAIPGFEQRREDVYTNRCEPSKRKLFLKKQLIYFCIGENNYIDIVRYSILSQHTVFFIYCATC